jgi:hypothetical protein
MRVKLFRFTMMAVLFLSGLFPLAAATPTAEERLALKKSIEGRWDSLTKNMVFDFETTTGDFGCQAADVRLSLAPVTEIPDAVRKDHGSYLLRIDMNFRKTNQDQRLIQTHFMDEDWTDVLGVQFDVFIPAGSIDTLTVTPFMMCNQWQLWSQDETKTPLVPGKWVTVKFVPAAGEKINMARVTTIGFFLWGSFPKAFKGPVYLDNFVLLTEKPLKRSPVLPSTEVKTSQSVTVRVEGGMTGGTVSPYLLSINSGAAVLDVSPDLLKQAGPGGLLRTWGWLEQIDSFNPSRGVYDWTESDRIINAIRNSGWEPLVTLGLCPSWMATKNSAGQPKKNGPPTDPALWAEMAAAMVKHYNIDLKYGIKYWEIWNEPDIFFWGGTEDEYNKLCAAASKAMKKVDPTIQVIGGAWASSLAPTSSRLSTLLAAGPEISCISYHNYLLGSANFTEKELWEKLPSGSEAPVYKGRKAIRAVSAQLGTPGYTNLDILMTEACIQPDTRYDPRVETVLYPVYWATALWHYVHQNLRAAVFFTLTGKVWGVFYQKPRPVFDLFVLLRDKAKFDNAQWLRTSGEPEDLKVLALRHPGSVSFVLVNKSMTGVKYDATLKLENIEGIDSFAVYRLSSTDDGRKSAGSLKNTGTVSVECPPYSVTVLYGAVKPGTPEPVLAGFKEEPSPAAMGFLSSGQYSFAGQKAEFLKAAGPVKIDGDLKEFAKAKKFRIGKKENISAGDAAYWTGPSDASADVRALWDRDNLYLAIEVADDAPMISFVQRPDGLFDGDCIELFIGTKYVHLSRTTKGEYDYQFLIAPKGGSFRPKEGVLFSEPGPGLGTRNAELKNSEIFVKKTKKGYLMEVRISGENFYEFSGFQPGQEFRFDIGIDDSDKFKREVQLMWNASKQEVWDNPDLWGVAVLK